MNLGLVAGTALVLPVPPLHVLSITVASEKMCNEEIQFEDTRLTCYVNLVIKFITRLNKVFDEGLCIWHSFHQTCNTVLGCFIFMRVFTQF